MRPCSLVVLAVLAVTADAAPEHGEHTGQWALAGDAWFKAAGR